MSRVLWSVVLFAFLQGGLQAKTMYFNDTKAVGSQLVTRLVDEGRSESPASIRIEFNVDGFEIFKNEDGFQFLQIDGLTPQGIEGMPETQTTGSLLSIPNGYEAKLTVLSKNETFIPGLVLAPFQVKSRCASMKNTGFQFNRGFYSSSEVFPQQMFGLEKLGMMRSAELARVFLNPVQMDMGQKGVRVLQRISLQVDFVPAKARKNIACLPAAFHQLLQNTVVNGVAVKECRQPETLLIYTADDFKESLKPLVDWKKERGIQVTVVTATEAGNTKDAILEHLKNYSSTNGIPTYLLFVGNKDTMPPFKQPTSFGNAASDYPFSLLAGDDQLPDTLYGRIVADNTDDLAAQVSRWLQYEVEANADQTHFPWGTTIASREGSNPSDAEYAQHVATNLTAGGYSKINVFEQGKENATPENVTTAVNEGTSWISYFGHGSGISWGSTNGSFTVSHVDKLENAGKLPVIIDVACLNAAYDTVSRCFGKAWVTHRASDANAGAVAFYGGSVSISWHPPAIMSEGISKYHFEKPVHTLGGSVLAGQMYLIEKNGMVDGTIDNLEWYNLFGDPSLLVRTAVPKNYAVALQQSDSALTLKAADANGVAMGGLSVAVTDKVANNLLGTAVTDANGEASLQVAPQSIRVTTTGYNFATVQIDRE